MTIANINWLAVRFAQATGQLIISCTIVVMLMFSITTASAAALQAIPALSSPVTDVTNTLSSAEQQALAQKLSAFAQEKGSQIAVLIVPTTQPEDIAQYSLRVAEAWQIGRDKEDDGVIILLAKNDRKMRIEVGYGLEGAIPDAIARRIVSDVMAPYFRQGDFAGGLNAAVAQLMALISGEALPAPAKKQAGASSFLITYPYSCLGRFFPAWCYGDCLVNSSVARLTVEHWVCWFGFWAVRC